MRPLAGLWEGCEEGGIGSLMNIHHRTFRGRIPFIKPPPDSDCCSQISAIRFKWADMLLLSASDWCVCSCENHRRLLMTQQLSGRGVPCLECRARRLTPVTRFQGAECKLTGTAKNTNQMGPLMPLCCWCFPPCEFDTRCWKVRGTVVVLLSGFCMFHVRLQHRTQSDFVSRLWREAGVEK